MKYFTKTYALYCPHQYKKQRMWSSGHSIFFFLEIVKLLDAHGQRIKMAIS